MKGLLHSKRFKTLLKKWLFMYIGVIALFTTVVTYSKYMSSLNVSDEARTTQFDVQIQKTNAHKIDCNVCENDLENDCSLCSDVNNYKPLNEISYYFKVDTTKLEVWTKFILTVRADDNFKIVKIIDITDSENEKVVYDGESKTSKEEKLVSLINANAGKVAYYKVIVKFTGNIGDLTADPYNIVQVDFSAKQITKESDLDEE